jgi:tryptophan halogenase
MNIPYTKNKLVIVGGGSAGWMTALYLKKLHPTCEISVVEDPDRPPIIAGESGTITFVSFLKSLGIGIDDFVRHTNATPKLGGRFKNWNGVGHEFIHALQTDITPWLDEVDNDLTSFSQTIAGLNREHTSDNYVSTIIANDIPLSKAFYAYQFIDQNKVPFGGDADSLSIAPMWHFESRAAAAYLKNIGISRNIKLIEGKYKFSNQSTSGDILSVVLEDDTIVAGDWFFDCSGFARLLLGGVLNEPLIDYSNFFPARAVVAWWDKAEPSVTSNANAMEYGWSWNINLRHRSGNGYIYDPDHINLDQAVLEAEKFYGYKIDPIANFSFTPGIMKNTWKNNVIAVGLSGGFLEPLEANGVQVIIDTLWAIEDLWKPTIQSNFKQRQDLFNLRVFANTEDIRDFISLHYRGKRRDTEFWKSHAYDKFRIPTSLNDKLDQWGKYYAGEAWAFPRSNGYSPTAWLMVLQALDIFDTAPLKARKSQLLAIGKTALNNNYNRYRDYANSCLTIEDWLKNSINT